MPDDPDIRWVSYAELAEARGIDRLSAVRIVRNRGWQKQKGNDGTIRVAVPRNFLETKRGGRENPREIPPEITRKIIGLETRVELLIEELDRERSQTIGLREERAAANAHAEAAAAQAHEMIARLEAAQESENRLREDRAAAVAEKEAVQAQLDDTKAEARKEGEGRAKAEARAELLQTENEKLRAEARAEAPRRRRWRFWGRRG